MNLSYIIQQTLLMMGFTFLVGVAFAYVLKLMTLIFSSLSGEGLPALAGKVRARVYTYCAELAQTYEYIRSTVRTDDGMMNEMPLDPETKNETVYAMNEMAEYHFGNLEDPSAKETDTNLRYGLNHGKI